MDLGTKTSTSDVLGRGDASGVPVSWKVLYRFTSPTDKECFLEVGMAWSTWVESDHCKNKGLNILISSDGYVCSTNTNGTAYLTYIDKIENNVSDPKIKGSDKISAKTNYMWMLQSNI